MDPAVQLWNRPLDENLRYGLAAAPSGSIESVIEAAELARVIERLPDGLATPLGEGGGLVSGGEGQRVRLGRALLRPGVRLAILDEPFRGLDIDQRHKLLERSRETWRDATLLAISHDIAEAMAFDRVLVLEDGQIVEDGDTARAGQQSPIALPRLARSRARGPRSVLEWTGVATPASRKWPTQFLAGGCGPP